MDEKLVITREAMPGFLLLHVSGRIDGYWSAMLDETLSKALRAGDHNVALDLENVIYLSSLGIRIFIKYVKLFKSVDGSFGITHISPGVLSVLEMVGLESQLKWQEPAGKKDDTTNSTSSKREMEGFCFKSHAILEKEDERPFKYTLTGSPEKFHTSGFTKEDCIGIKFGKGRYGIGLGAIGADFNDCQGRFGEYIALGDSVAYLPSGKNNTPDYMVTRGSLIPEMKVLYGIQFEGEFSRFIRFSPLAQNSRLPMNFIIKAIKDITGFDTFAFVMVAESAGIVGASLSKLPSAGTNPLGYPQVRDDISFTTEQEFNGCMTLSAGIISKDNDVDLGRFARPVEDSGDLIQHIHSAIFNYYPLSKEELRLDETVNSLFEEDKILSVLHLLNDQRESIGIGQSEFTQGACWVGALN